MNNKIKLDVGCGNKKRPGFTGLDKINLKGVDLVCDLDKEGIPLKDNSVGEIHTRHFLEHVSDLVKVMDEFWRISCNRGKLIVVVPYYNSIGAFTDPTHKRFFAYRTFDYFTQTTKCPSFYTGRKFRIIKKKILFYPENSNLFGKIRFFYLLPLQLLANWLPYVYEHSFLKLFSAHDLFIELEALKDN